MKKNLKVIRGELREKGVDVALATDMLSLGLKGAYDIAVLVSGDSDYVGALDKLKSEGIRIEVAMFKCATGSDLRKIADKYITLDELSDQIEKI